MPLLKHHCLRPQVLQFGTVYVQSLCCLPPLLSNHFKPLPGSRHGGTGIGRCLTCSGEFAFGLDECILRGREARRAGTTAGRPAVNLGVNLFDLPIERHQVSLGLVTAESLDREVYGMDIGVERLAAGVGLASSLNRGNTQGGERRIDCGAGFLQTVRSLGQRPTAAWGNPHGTRHRAADEQLRRRRDRYGRSDVEINSAKRHGPGRREHLDPRGDGLERGVGRIASPVEPREFGHVGRGDRRQPCAFCTEFLRLLPLLRNP